MIDQPTNGNGEFRGRTQAQLEDVQGDIKSLWGAYDKLQGNFQKINDHSGELSNKQEQIATDVAWLKKFFWVVATTSITAAVTSFFQLISHE